MTDNVTSEGGFEGEIFFDAEYRAGGPCSYILVVKGVTTSGPIGLASDNHDAEWQAANHALEHATERGWKRFLCTGDSKLVIDRAEWNFDDIEPEGKYYDRLVRCKEFSSGLHVERRRTLSKEHSAGKAIRNHQEREKYLRKRCTSSSREGGPSNGWVFDPRL